LNLVHGGQVTPTGLTHLTRLTHLESVELNLSCHGKQSLSKEQLSGWTRLRRLTLLGQPRCDPPTIPRLLNILATLNRLRFVSVSAAWINGFEPTAEPSWHGRLRWVESYYEFPEAPKTALDNIPSAGLHTLLYSAGFPARLASRLQKIHVGTSFPGTLQGCSNLRVLIANRDDPFVSIGAADLQNLCRIQQLLLKDIVFNELALIQRFKHLESLHFRAYVARAVPRRLGSLRDSKCQALASLPKLRDLSLGRSALSAVCFNALATLRHLEQLAMNPTHLDVAALAALKRLKSLSSLDLGSARIPEQGVRQLGQLHLLEALTSIHLPLNDNTAPQLTTLTRLRMLEADARNLTAKGLQSLCALRRLRYVKLHNLRGQIGILGKLACLPQLRSITVFDPQLTAHGADRLRTLPALRQLVVTNDEKDTERRFQSIRVLQSAIRRVLPHVHRY
jgi:hypothetical protein